MIIDDEPIAHRIIEDYCKALQHLTLANQSYDALQALHYLATSNVDLIFLDLNMPKLKGFDFLRTLTKPPQVIVTSAYQEFALQGFEMNVCDYLLKPFSFERFLGAVNKACANMQLNAALKLSSTKNNSTGLSCEASAIPDVDLSRRIFVKGDKKHHQVLLVDILYIEACGNYCQIYLPHMKIITYQKISQFEQELPQDMFIRIHKSYLVATAKIEAIAVNELTIANTALPIGQTYKAAVVGLIKPISSSG